VELAFVSHNNSTQKTRMRRKYNSFSPVIHCNRNREN